MVMENGRHLDYMHPYLLTEPSSIFTPVVEFQSAQAGNPGRLKNAGSFFGFLGLSQASAFVFTRELFWVEACKTRFLSNYIHVKLSWYKYFSFLGGQKLI